jgi:hypothetical protein
MNIHFGYRLGKHEGTFYWHGRDNSTRRELNPKVLNYSTLCIIQGFKRKKKSDLPIQCDFFLK